VSGGVHVGGVVVTDGADRVRDILIPVYEALGLTWTPATTGSVASEVPGATWEQVSEAILAEYGELYELEPTELDEETLALARRLAPDHLSPEGAQRSGADQS